MRFLHIADLHLDTPFAGRSEALRLRLRAALRTALVRCVDTALAEEVDALLIAGDLLDGDFLSFDSERFLLGQLARLDEAGIQTIYATGNHDPGNSRRICTLDWPASVTVIADADPVTVAVRRHAPHDLTSEIVGSVTGVGHATAEEMRDLSEALIGSSDEAGPGALPQVAILHTQVVSAAGRGVHRPYAPSSLDRLRSAGFHYWALGHLHAPQELSAHPPVHYSGSIQGCDPTESGPRGGLLVDLQNPESPVVEFREFAPLRWERLAVTDLAGTHSLDDAAGQIEEAWRAARQADPGAPGTEWVLRGDLSGPSPLWQQLRDPDELDTLADETGARLGLAGVDLSAAGVHPPVRPDAYVDRPDVLGRALALARSVAAGDDPMGIDETDLAGFDPGRDSDVAAYLGRILGGIEEEIIVRMLDSAEDAA